MGARLKVFAIGVMLLVTGCAADGTGDEPEFGLGGKADGICNPASDLCWNTADIKTMREIDRASRSYGLGRQSSADTLSALFDGAQGLSHKLQEDELSALEEIGERASELGVDAAIAELEKRVFFRVRATYVGAYMVPVGRAADLELSGKGDDGDSKSMYPDPDGYSEDMRRSLNDLREGSVSGMVFASALELSGALDVTYEVINEQTFSPPRGASREERAGDVVDKYALWALGSGAVSGAIALIPFYGIPLSIPVSALGTLMIHSHMTLELAAVYGWNIREGRDLFIVGMFLFSEEELGETEVGLGELGEQLASLSSLHRLVRSLAGQLGVPVTTTLAVKVTAGALVTLLKFLVKKARAALSKAAAEHVGRAVAGQVLGYATLGIAVAASAAADYYVTQQIGDHIRVMAKPWIVDLPLEGTEFLSAEYPRSCFFSTMVALMWADGEVSDREQGFYKAFLAKPYYEGAERWYELDSAERQRRSFELRASSSASCVEAVFEEVPALDKLSLISYFRAAVMLDGELSAAEEELYRELVDVLDGDGFFDGDELDSYHIAFIEKAIERVLDPDPSAWPDEYSDEIQGFTVEDMLPYLIDVDPAVEADFACGYRAEC